MKDLMRATISISVAWMVSFAIDLPAQTPQTYRVFFRDKGPDPFAPGSELYRATEQIITQRARARRAKVTTSDTILRWSDAPLYQPYLDDIERTGARILLQLRWRNYAVVECDSIVAARIASKPYVTAVIPTHQVLRPMHSREQQPNPIVPAYNYGTSFEQLDMLGITNLHGIGVGGEGVLVGVIDTGFRWRDHEAFQQTKVIAEFDFIDNDTITANQDNDHPRQDNHGTVVLSVIAGFYPDSLIGSAPCAQYILAKTENIASERRIEEDAYAAAVEWMEAQGVDIINTSLGYDKFDSTEEPYSRTDLNGKTTIVACAVNDAVDRGVICVVAAGNNGDAAETISSPGDSERAITVGAFANSTLEIPRFTSRGPTADGRLKPDVAALGVNVRSASLAGPVSFGYASGTSMATPLITGAVALLLQVFPELTPSQVRFLLQSVGSHAVEPNTAIGYGAPNVRDAALRWNIVCSPPFVIPRGDRLLIGVGALSAYSLTSIRLFLSDNLSTREYALLPFGNNVYGVEVPYPSGDSIEMYFLLRDEQRERRYPLFGSLRCYARDTLLPCGWKVSSMLSHLSSPHSGNEHRVTLTPVALSRAESLLSVANECYSMKCTIYDLTFRKIETVFPQENFVQTIDLSNLQAGTYLLLFECKDKVYTQLVLLY